MDIEIMELGAKCMTLSEKFRTTAALEYCTKEQDEEFNQMIRDWTNKILEGEGIKFSYCIKFDHILDSATIAEGENLQEIAAKITPGEGHTFAVHVTTERKGRTNHFYQTGLYYPELV